MIAATAAATFGSPLLWSLSRPIPFRLQQRLGVDTTQAVRAVQIPELSYLRRSDGQSTYRLRLTATQLSPLLQEPEIRLEVANYENSRNIVSAAISSADANCSYAARSGETFPNNSMLVFVRREHCAPIQDGRQAELILTVQLDKPGPIAVWTGARPSNESAVAILIADKRDINGAPRAIVGTIGRSDPSGSKSRLVLLNYVWQLSESASWLVGFLGIATTLVAVAFFLLADARILGGEVSLRSRMGSMVGAACLALAFACVYACTVPPFQAADEPHHFAALATFLGTPALAVEATHLGQIGHIDQIRFDPAQHFNPSDVGHLGAILTVGVIPDMDMRGTGVFAVWRVFAPLLRGHTPAATLLLARTLNAVVFAAAVGAFVYLAAGFTPSRWPILDVFPALIIPTLPFFGMQVSNYAPLCATYILIAGGVSVFLWDGPRSWAAGPALGGAWAGAILLSRSALPLAPLLLGCGLARLVSHERRESRGAVVAFWLGLSLPCAVALALLPGPLRDLVQSTLAPAGTHGRLAVAALPLAVIGAAVIAATVELRWKRSSDQRELHVDRVVRRGAGIGAIMVAVVMVGSIFIAYPVAPAPDQAHVAAPGRYVIEMLLAGLTMFRFGQPDFDTSMSFWSGFGWLDTLLPNWTVTALAISCGLALIATLIWIARASRPTPGVHFFLMILGLIAAFALSAFSVVRITPASLHGRYLLGVYLCVVILCWHFLPQVASDMTRRTRAIVLAACGLAAITVHAWATVTILARYFG